MSHRSVGLQCVMGGDSYTPDTVVNDTWFSSPEFLKSINVSQCQIFNIIFFNYIKKF